jgi:hypothetical protein
MKKTYGRMIIRPYRCALAIAAGALVSFIACTVPAADKNEFTPAPPVVPAAPLTGTVANTLNADGTITVTIPTTAPAGRSFIADDIKEGALIDYYEVIFRSGTAATTGNYHWYATGAKKGGRLSLNVPPGEYDILFLAGHYATKTLLASAYYHDAGNAPSDHIFTVALGANVINLTLKPLIWDLLGENSAYQNAESLKCSIIGEVTTPSETVALGAGGYVSTPASAGVKHLARTSEGIPYVQIDANETKLTFQWGIDLGDLKLAFANNPWTTTFTPIAGSTGSANRPVGKIVSTDPAFYVTDSAGPTNSSGLNTAATATSVRIASRSFTVSPGQNVTAKLSFDLATCGFSTDEDYATAVSQGDITGSVSTWHIHNGLYPEEFDTGSNSANHVASTGGAVAIIYDAGSSTVDIGTLAF